MDKTKAPVKEKVVAKSTDKDVLLHFNVQGQFGPMTLTFKFIGKHPAAPSELTEEEAMELSAEEVQVWYTKYGWPKHGYLRTVTDDRRAKGLFQLM